MGGGGGDIDREGKGVLTPYLPSGRFVWAFPSCYFQTEGQFRKLI